MAKLNLSDIEICESDERIIRDLQDIVYLYRKQGEAEQRFLLTIKTYKGIKAIGIKNAIVLKRGDKGYLVVRGRTRLAVAREMGIPVINAFIEGEDDPQKIREAQKL